VDASTTFTEQEADERLLKSLVHRVVLVKSVLTQPANENQLAAMVSLHYNIGHAAFAKSTVLRQHNAGNFDGAARAFALWNLYTNPRTGKKEVAPGLVSRRAIEAALYLKPTEDDMPARMPQAVASESNLAASPIAQGGGATAATGAAVVLASVGDQAQQVSGLMGSVKVAADALKDGATSVAGVLGMPPGVLVGLVLVVVGFFIVKWRRQQRLEGWA
jgi:lysozyme